MRRFLIYLGAIIAATSSVNAKDLVVLKSNTDSIRAGQVLDGNALLNLDAGTRVSLMTEDGQPLDLQGPYRGKPSPGKKAKGGGEVVAALSGLVTRGGLENKSLGTFRVPPGEPGVPAVRPGPGADDIDPVAGEPQCARSGRLPSLWIRQQPDGASAVLHAPTGNSAAIAVVEARAAWPAGITLTDGATYRLSLASPVDGAAEASFTVRLIAAGQGADSLAAAAMAALHCDRQARSLLSSVVR